MHEICNDPITLFSVAAQGTDHVCHEITDVKELKETLSTITDWEILAEKLDVPNEKIMAIEADKKGVDLKRSAVLQSWYDLQPRNPCWETVAEALERMGKVRLATDIKNSIECITKGKDLNLADCIKHGEDARDQSVSGATVIISSVIGILLIVLNYIFCGHRKEQQGTVHTTF